jgi:topoisomerase-4 subunit A
MKKSKNNNIPENQVIDPQPMQDVMADDFGRYAKAVLSDRAIPDVRDGLKPVQRRIIFGMSVEGNTFDKPTRKSATTVGFVMGHYHPHGDSSIYDALVRLSQDWKMEVPLVTFQGNNGSIDNDPAAASRYTEAKLSKIAGLMVQDLDKDTVNMQLNFSDEELEPTVLPARFPNLLVNGAQGIAVGAATNIPTHNLGEVIDATVYAIQHKRATVADLRQFILGPDFPTGGMIDQPEELNKLYESGSASFYIHVNAEVDKEKNQIVITDVPYGVVKSDFVAALDKARENSHIDNITEVRDESTADVRIAIDIKEGQDPYPILSFLHSKGLLRTTFPANMLAIDKGHPKTMNLLDIIHSYIDHQVDVVTRRSKFLLAKDSKRKEVVEGLIKCVDIVDQVIEVIKKCNGKQESKEAIIKQFSFTPDQAEAIVMLNLYKINKLDYQTFVDEKNQLDTEIADLNHLLSDRDYLDRRIIKDLKDVRAEYAVPRKTKILEHEIETVEYDQTSLISKEDVHVVITSDGYIKRVSDKSYMASVSDNLSDSLPKVKQGDGIVLNQKISTHDGVLVFFSSGTFAYIPVYIIPEAKWKEEGRHMNFLVKNLTADDRAVSAFGITTFDLKTYVCLLTKEGKIKRTALKEFSQVKLTSRSIRCMGISEGDELIKAEVTSGNSDVIIAQSNGFVSRYNENEVPVVGIKAGGVKAMNLGKNNPPLSDMVVLNSDEHVKLLAVTDKGAARIIMSGNVETGPRLGLKTALIKIFKSSPMDLICLRKEPVTKAEVQEIAVYTENENVVVDLKNLEAVLPGSGMKPNIPLNDDKPIKGVHDEGGFIDDSFHLEEPKMVVGQTKAKEDTSGVQQLTLFDLFDQEEGKK